MAPRLVFGLALALLSTTASAQQAQQQDKIYTLQLPASQLNYIATLLGEQKWKEAAPIINSIVTQVQAQDRPPPKTEDDKP